MKSVEAVTLDLDGTLCEYRESSAELLARSFDQLDVEPFFTAEEYRQQLYVQVVTDETKAERREEAFTTLAERADHGSKLGRQLATVYASMRDHADVKPLPGAVEAVEYLRDRYALGLVTNGGPETQDPKLSTLGIADAFDEVVYGGYDTAPKPEPAPFHDAIRALDARPRRVIHVGNSVESDVWGADAAGIGAALVSTENQHMTAPDYLLGSLGELTPPPWE